jgi:hypothetical protein
MTDLSALRSPCASLPAENCYVPVIHISHLVAGKPLQSIETRRPPHFGDEVMSTAHRLGCRGRRCTDRDVAGTDARRHTNGIAAPETSTRNPTTLVKCSPEDDQHRRAVSRQRAPVWPPVSECSDTTQQDVRRPARSCHPTTGEEAAIAHTLSARRVTRDSGRRIRTTQAPDGPLAEIIGPTQL